MSLSEVKHRLVMDDAGALFGLFPTTSLIYWKLTIGTKSYRGLVSVLSVIAFVNRHEPFSILCWSF